MTAADSPAWVCGDCSLPEELGRPLRQACHHCGRVLCPDCQQIIHDGAFVGRWGMRSRAVHCRRCRERHHPRLLPW